MKILEAQIMNPYRSKRPLGFYHPIKGHTGVDLRYRFQPIASPITGKVVAKIRLPEMGWVLCLEDIKGSIHVHSHLSEYKVSLNDQVKRDQIIAISGNSGGKTTAPHLHYEIIAQKPDGILGRVMTRYLMGFKGYNVDPLNYLKALYKEYHVPTP
jgi:murein DD-endopeptidase MepM/ murein hydrolase activator NlpD